MVDLGSELLIADRLRQGQILYKDFFYLYGPFTPYFHAGVFSLFGLAREVLAGANLVFFAGTLFCLARLLRFVVARETIPVVIIFVLVVHGFNQTEVDGNFNFLLPYRSAIVHALFFALLSVNLLLASWGEGRRCLVNSFFSGLAGALVFLCKAEVFLAYGGAMAWGLAIHFCQNAFGRKMAGLWLLGIAVGLFAELSFFVLQAFSFGEAVSWTLHPYLLVLNEELRSLSFYRVNAGKPGAQYFRDLFLWALILSFPFLYRKLRGQIEPTLIVLYGILILVAAGISGEFRGVLLGYGHLTPLVALVLFLFLAIRRLRGSSRLSKAGWLAEVAAAFSTLLALKIWFLADSIFYGFVLALPAMVAFLFSCTNSCLPILARGRQLGSWRSLYCFPMRSLFSSTAIPTSRTSPYALRARWAVFNTIRTKRNVYGRS